MVSKYSIDAQLIQYPSIGSLAQLRKKLRFNSDALSLLTTDLVRFIGRNKAHGMCVGVALDVKYDTYSIQTRGTVVSNAGVKDQTGTLRDFEGRDLARMFAEVRTVLADKFGVVPTDTIVIAGERCGGNVQKHVGLTKFVDHKLFIVFDVFADGVWYSAHIGEFVGVECPAEHVYHVDRFSRSDEDVYEHDMSAEDEDDTAAPTVVQAATDRVDAACPIVVALLPEFAADPGHGEGIVWTLSPASYLALQASGLSTDELQLWRFKSKGASHHGPPPKIKAPGGGAAEDIPSSSLLDVYATPAVCRDVILKFNVDPVMTNAKRHGDLVVQDVLGSIDVELSADEKTAVVRGARRIAIEFFKAWCKDQKVLAKNV